MCHVHIYLSILFLNQFVCWHVEFLHYYLCPLLTNYQHKQVRDLRHSIPALTGLSSWQILEKNERLWG